MFLPRTCISGRQMRRSLFPWRHITATFGRIWLIVHKENRPGYTTDGSFDSRPATAALNVRYSNTANPARVPSSHLAARRCHQTAASQSTGVADDEAGAMPSTNATHGRRRRALIEHAAGGRGRGGVPSPPLPPQPAGAPMKLHSRIETAGVRPAGRLLGHAQTGGDTRLAG